LRGRRNTGRSWLESLYYGFGINAHATGRKVMILADGSDLTALLEGRSDLMEALYRKNRFAAQTGAIYLRIYGLLQHIDNMNIYLV
jgi:hypothetical protein